MGLRIAGRACSQLHSNRTSTEEDIRPILRSSLNRIHSWPAPPNWSHRDWFCEAENVAKAAAWQAAADYPPLIEVAFGSFVHQRVMSCTRTRYRQEFLYGLRFSIQLITSDDDLPDDKSNQTVLPCGSRPVEQLIYFDLTDALGELSSEQRGLIEQLFWFEHTEMQLAHTLGISQVAVNKRKRIILRTLRGLLGEK